MGKVSSTMTSERIKEVSVLLTKKINQSKNKYHTRKFMDK
jgi:hypothetical protein